MTIISAKDIENAVAKAKTDEPSGITKDTRSCVCYGKDAIEVKEDSTDVYLKNTVVNKQHTYWILRGPNNRIFNPYDLSYDDASRRRNINNIRQGYKIKETTQQVFDLYLSFLKTKNLAYLRNAERAE